MKSADFKRSTSKIRVLEEVRPVKRKINWDRTIYLTALLIVLGIVLFVAGRSNFFIRGEGQVLFKKLEIQFTQDVQIIEFIKSEGDSVSVGDTLFRYYDENSVNQLVSKVTGNPIKIISSDNLDWIVRERITTEKRIELAKIQIDEQERLINMTKGEKKRVEKEVYLDVYPAAKLDKYTTRLIDYASNIESAKEEILFYKKYLNHLVLQEKLERSKIHQQNAIANNIQPVILHAYVSPVKGTITQIRKENYEVALESDVIMSIHKPTNLYIKAFYDQEDVKHLHQGDVVDVRFPDGTESYGILQRFYSATYQLPDEFQKKYEPTTRSIAADITPIDGMELQKWKPFYKLNVQVSKPLY
ncbi:MAG: HlyD family efflux transporter periplasmic adaptor subunit [Saprospiraceae bacterium]|nr:HlyD family efflux transporter periplasmic adaptor subunit [Saprospiraceae bacterium]